MLVSVDTLRADHLGAYGGTLGLSPRIDALALESLVFDRAYAPTSFTMPSISSLLTGRYPEEIGVLGNRSALAPDIPTLATVLRDHGWATAAVVSNLVLRANSGLSEGFDHYDDVLPGREATREWSERIASGTTDAAIDVLEALPADEDTRLFLWVHYQDPHGPYTPPDGLREALLPEQRRRPEGLRRLTPAEGRGVRGRLPAYQEIDGQREVAFYRAGYAAEVQYLDREFGRLLDALSARGLGDTSLIVFTADHGESLGERDYWFGHGELLTDPLVRVPLMLRIPGGDAGRRSDLVAQVDLFPTLLHLLEGVAIPADARGRDLLEADAGSVDSLPYLASLASFHTARFGIVLGNHKLILVETERGWRPELYRLGHEDRELSDLDPERTERMRAELLGLQAELQTGRRENLQRLSDRDRRNLEALGYTEKLLDPGVD
ncbi:MAG: sulfatase [Myxococcota bacterium]